MKKAFTIVLAVLMALSIAACSANKAPAGTTTPLVSATVQPSAQETKSTATRTITDMAGNQVVIPAKIERIAEAWFAHNEIDVMLGGDDRLVATCMTKAAYPWLYMISKGLSNALSTFGTDFNMEELMQKQPDIVFCSTSDKNIDKLKSMGVPVVQLMFTNFEEMMKCVTLTGDILGGDAVNRAAAYNKYLTDKLSAIKAVTDKIKTADRPKVLHVNTLTPLTVDGSKTIIDDWINVAGGTNAAAELESNGKAVTIEQVMKWDPDIIILGSNGGKPSDITGNANWASISAVKNGAVYQNPAGGFLWDRYGAEEALQIQWAAKTLNPTLFKDLDIAAETKSFYKTFLRYDLTDEQVQKILTAQKP